MALSVAVIDPSLYTLPYDSAFCDALAGEGCTVSLYGRKLRANEAVLGTTPVQMLFYPVAESMRRVTEGAPFQFVKGLEHGRGMYRLHQRLKQMKPDVIHFQWLALPAVDQLALRAFKEIAPLFLTVHDLNPFNGSPGFKLRKLGSGKVFDAFDHMIVHSESSRQALIARGQDPRRITTIPHGPLLIPRPDEGPVEALPQTTILLFGSIKPYKGVDILVEAFGRLPRSLIRKSRLLIVGNPTFPIGKLKQRAAELGVADHVTWDLRFVPDSEVDAIMRQTDIFAFPYREIDTSGVLMSCLPYGKPIVAARLGAFSTLLKDGVHGHLVPPEDPDALRDALATLIGDQSAREVYGRNVASLSTTIPSWAEIADRTIAVYNRERGRRA
jgi:glycosyltransferase involved in cell wall biosynthesis